MGLLLEAVALTLDRGMVEMVEIRPLVALRR
jgi:hypothetical protein